MKDSRSHHLKVQEMCDCYLNTEPLREMSVLKNDADKDEAAVKWLALAILYGIDSNAKRISISASEDGDVKVVAKFRKTELPTPGKEVGKKVFDLVKQIAHFEGEEGATPLAVGIRDSSLEIELSSDKEGDERVVTLKFPK
ncbi:MAG: hypothetical protein HGB17_10900 [Syntrophobacteraceae bacterium]|nr:hypothetical protein [Syntrophobacteraceae bacterium]